MARHSHHLSQPPLLTLQDVKAGLQPHFVDSYDEIYRIAFPQP